MNKIEYPSDDDLVRCSIAGDRLAMEMLYKKHFTALYAVSARYANSDLDARSILNAAMHKAFLSLGTFQTGYPLFPWLKTIVIRTGLDQIRSDFRRQITGEIDQATEVYAEESIADWLDADLVNHLLRQLPSLSRSVFNLHALEGYTHAEIAIQLQISEGHSRWHLHQARHQIKKLLSAYESEKKYRMAVA